MAQKMKTITAGRLVYATVYTPPNPSDNGRQRAEKKKVSSEARQTMNLKKSWEKLELLLAENFRNCDWVLTLTFDDAHLPASKEDARKRIKKFYADLRVHRKKYRQLVKYAYRIEGEHGDKRLHGHVVLNAGRNDKKIIESLWTYGHVHWEHFDEEHVEELARYLTKEAREPGVAKVGERAWSTSLNLTKPDAPPAEWVPDNITLVAPPGAIILDSDARTTEYARYAFIKYLLPRAPKPRRKVAKTKVKQKNE